MWFRLGKSLVVLGTCIMPAKTRDAVIGALQNAAERPRVVIHFNEEAGQDFFCDGQVDCFVIDERVPRDRVYQLSNCYVARSEIDDLIGQSRVGRLGDMPGTEDAIRAHINGDPHPTPPPLKLV